ncbi:MAG: hypothetical protein GY928_14835 [Colwellia sp.]|nr:hypothetical protein [Colwellia sp.]
MKDLYKRGYKAVVKRGLINPGTSPDEFFEKLHEEFREVFEALADYNDSKNDNRKKERDHYIEELVDLMTVCVNQMIHLGYNPEKEYLKVIEKNERRAINIDSKQE